MMWAAVHWQNTITTGSVLIAAILSLIGFAEAVHFVRRKNRIADLESDLSEMQRELENADRAAKRWEVELRAAATAEQRLKLEQQEIRHDLKDKLAACQLELAAANMRTDQTTVLDGQKRIESGFLEALERMDERSAKRDQAMFATQREITELLKELTSRVTREVAEKVGEVVQEKVDQLQDLPSPDRKE